MAMTERPGHASGCGLREYLTSSVLTVDWVAVRCMEKPLWLISHLLEFEQEGEKMSKDINFVR